MTTYRTTCWGETHEISADFAQASCPVHGCPGKQVADFQHYPERAMRYALTQEAEAGGFNPYPQPDEEAYTCDDDVTARDEIEAAVAAMTEVVDEDED